MFSWSSRADLKVVGIEGHTPDTLRQEVARGASFVIYSYNFSLVVMSFKRPSHVHFIRPGQSRMARGLPFTLISLVFGWWGIPWGIIYTIQSLHANFSGGRDVTDDVMRSFPPPLAGDAPPRPMPPLPAAKPAGSFKSVALVGAAIALPLLAIYVGFCLYRGQNLPVALVAGTKAPYDVMVNGVRHTLRPGRPELLKLPQGNFAVEGAPGGALTFTASVPFWSRMFEQRVLVINPDAAAVLYLEKGKYHKTGTAGGSNEQNSVSLFVNQRFQFLLTPDYFFEDFPQKIEMPAGTNTVEKTRLGAFQNLNLPTTTTLVSTHLGYDALRDYLFNQARLNAGDPLLPIYLDAQLKPDDARRAFGLHLADRPVLVDWHRSYQAFMDRAFPQVDLTADYRRALEQEPGNGDLAYLCGRLLKDPARSHPLYTRALHAKPPCGYGGFALATDEFAAGHAAAALDFLREAETAGLHTPAFEMKRREVLLALGRPEAVLDLLRADRTKDPADPELYVQEMQLTQATRPDRRSGESANAAFLAGLRRRFGNQVDAAAYEHYLAARLAYALGDEREAAVRLAHVPGDLNAFETAVDRRDAAAAERAIAKIELKSTRFHWLLMIAAQAAGDAVAAERYYQAALANLVKIDSYSREIARQLAAPNPDHAAIRRTPNYADELRVMYTALGLRFPAERDAYFARARELDHDPAFPHLLLAAARGDAAVKKL